MADVGREFKPDVAFYLIMATLVVITLLAALESTSLSLALPTISTALNGTAIETFWAAISFLIASTALLPVLASLSGTFGRKPVVSLRNLHMQLDGGLAFYIAHLCTLLLHDRLRRFSLGSIYGDITSWSNGTGYWRHWVNMHSRNDHSRYLAPQTTSVVVWNPEPGMGRGICLWAACRRCVCSGRYVRSPNY